MNRPIVMVISFKNDKPKARIKFKKSVKWKPQIYEICPNTCSIKDLTFKEQVFYMDDRSDMWEWKVTYRRGMWNW